MRTLRTLGALGLAAIATPALSHAGDHAHSGPAHFIAQHGLAAAMIAGVVVIGGAAFVIAKRKG